MSIKVKQIRQDLKDIRYYYSRKSQFESSSIRVISNSIIEKAEKYNELVKDAPAKLYDVYICLYTQNCTQEAVAEELDYTAEYIHFLNNKLIMFFLSKLNKD